MNCKMLTAQVYIKMINVNYKIIVDIERIIQQQEVELKHLQQIQQQFNEENQIYRSNKDEIYCKELLTLNEKIIKLQNKLIANQNIIDYSINQIKYYYKKIDYYLNKEIDIQKVDIQKLLEQSQLIENNDLLIKDNNVKIDFYKNECETLKLSIKQD